MKPLLRILAPALSLLLVSPAVAQGDVQESAAEFVACADADKHMALNGTLCAQIPAPLDHQGEAARYIDLFVRKFPASGESQGQLWLVAGGPGEAGVSFYPFIDTIRASVPGFDLYIPDHRGTGFSTRLCVVEESPESDGGAALEGAEWGSCFGALNADPKRTKAFTISNAAHDLNLLMTRFDNGQKRYLYGVSYGTQLVLRTLAIAPPDNVDGVILDSIIPPETNAQWDLSRRSAVTDIVGRQVLRDCDQDPDCSKLFVRPLEEELQTLLADPAAQEMLGPKPKYTLSGLLDLPETRAMLPNVIAGLRAGDPAWLDHAKARLAGLGKMFAPYAQGFSSVPLVSLISRSENNPRPDLTAEQIAAEEEGLLFASPLPSLLLMGGIPDYERDEHFGTLPKVMPPTLLLHGDLDPKTAYAGAQEHVELLEAAEREVRLVTIKDAPHYILMTAPQCFVLSVRTFLADGLPPASTLCDLDAD
ncbi:alpha/beta hydrolase [Alterisphingorhabdus coralli]|uniref:Alpha/beta fold hydrolase n=1 Tax=Alterisphingorhabdus coralli TaxID=3071408 RepID=A0AA97FAE2_9SPHN|nr:alpha/beta fold hydrolase [Parasphingorhabdus sp. SCSIO 66989]WOE76103.1 alpha/beta fold hydrolase [Parasphingorhabdus sp. SCSIO 66989]